MHIFSESHRRKSFTKIKWGKNRKIWDPEKRGHNIEENIQENHKEKCQEPVVRAGGGR